VGFSLFQTPEIWSVSDLTRYIRQTLESDYRLRDVWVSGEASNVSRPSSGHLYFTLKDEATSLRCVMWRSEVEAQLRLPREGEALEVFGRISVYEAGGQYQLYAEQIHPAGEGLRHLEFVRLKEKLESEGLFDPARKQPLPERPRVIGVVTSPSGAALQDVLQVLRRRYPLVTILLAPTPVQGDEAPQGIIAALARLERHALANVILLVRGGGSAEDLAAFNDEGVVRAVAATSIPLVSGIGHATDLLLTDFAADVYAPTPTAAAELVTPDRAVLIEELKEHRARSIKAFAERLATLKQQRMILHARLVRVSPGARILSSRQQLDDQIHRASMGLRHHISLARASTESLALALRAFNPDAVLQRGYALVTRMRDEHLVASVGQVDPGESIRVRLKDGSFEATVRDQNQIKDT
jgi:exodeoxyribonuclease VII large subunit